ncbi:ABC transporter permease [Streptomyces sp. CWNU-1]|uniref:ABC transporter permease n=2 Tax=Streptomyces albipurpureus TaxID=2897419 RepID=A0ABT0UE80_9ACTN|nr:ABC transporter permease [Streptomyces sp. CWNU-1]
MAVMTESALVRRRGLGRRFGGNKAMTLSIGVLTLFVLVALFAPWLAPHDPNAVSLANSLQGTSADHLLGTDQSGRDVLSRLIYGARSSLLGPLGVVVGATLLGVTIGVVAAWRGGWVDTALSRAIELIFAFPGVLLAILLVSVLSAGLKATVLALAIAYTPYMARMTRSAALSERHRPYIRALEIQGFPAVSIIVRHLLPNIAPLVLAQASLCFGYAMIDLAGLSFLGFGVQPPQADWGAMISEGQVALLQGAPLSALAPGVLIVCAVVGFSLIGEGVADRIRRADR